MDLLCRFAHRFPSLAAEILERDRHKKRNFREETITDILMAGLVPFEPFNISTNYPVNEALTGEDMDWEFVDEHAVDGRKYLRLHIQAKRAVVNAPKTKPYWLYRELDHAVVLKAPKAKGLGPVPPPAKLHGTQHKNLVDEAKKVAGCVPIFMFYHPNSALDPASSHLPAVEGVNWMFADLIPVNVTPSRWPSAHKTLKKWRPHFHPLSDLLCFGHGPEFIELKAQDGSYFSFLTGPRSSGATPGEMEDRLNERRYTEGAPLEPPPIRSADNIPEQTLAIIDAARDGKRSAEIERPRVIFVSGERSTEAAIIRRG
jgi:hypothetical protein